MRYMSYQICLLYTPLYYSRCSYETATVNLKEYMKAKPLSVLMPRITSKSFGSRGVIAVE